MKQDINVLFKVAQWNFSDITCGAEFEMITLDKHKSVPLNRTMMTVADTFVIDETLPVWYGRNGKYYNTVWLINYILWAHRAELKSSYHVTFDVPPPPTEDEAFLNINILNLAGVKLWTIMPDGLSYMPEIVTSAWPVDEVKRNSSLIRSLIEYAVRKIDGTIADKQLPYVLWNYDMIESISWIAWKKDAYYEILIQSLSHWWRKVGDLDEQWVREMRESEAGDEECPMWLLQARACLGEQTLKKRWFSHNAATTSHHLHVSWPTLKDTVDMFMALMRYEWKIRHEYGTAYFEQLWKWYMRHVAFGSLIALRYWISLKTKKFLHKLGYDPEWELPEDAIKQIEHNHLLLPWLRVSSALSNGRDPEWSLACQVYQKVQDTMKSWAWWMVAEQDILLMIGQKFFSRPQKFVDAYMLWENTVGWWLLRSHSDIVLKTPAEVAPWKFVLTIELRWQDYPPLTDFARDETRESYVIQNNLYLLQKSASQFTESLQKSYTS